MATKKQKSGSAKSATPKDKLFVIKKYVMAQSAIEAIKKEKEVSVDDVWVDDDWRKGNADKLESAIGFEVDYEEEEEE